MRISEFENAFRDTRIEQLTISYDYRKSDNAVILALSKRNESKRTYKFSQVTYFGFFEDFSSAAISHCKVIETEEGIYTSLDPYLENGVIDERDNMTIRSKKIEPIE